MDRYEIIEDVASQRMWFFAEEGRPSATPTVGTADSGGSALTAAAATYVTQSTVNTTIAASAAVGAESVTVTSATGIEVGKRYLLTSEYGRTEWITVDGISSTTVYLVTPLQTAFDLVDGATYGTFASTEFYYTLQSTDYDTLREKNIATATYAVGGLTYKARQLFDVVKVPLPNALTPGVVYDRYGPSIANQDPKQGSDFEGQRVAAWRIVKRRIYQHCSSIGQWRPSMVVDPTDLEEWALAVFTRICTEQGIGIMREDLGYRPLEQLLKTEELEAERALRTITFLDADESGTESEGEAMPLAADFIR